MVNFSLVVMNVRTMLQLSCDNNDNDNSDNDIEIVKTSNDANEIVIVTIMMMNQ